MTILQIEYFLAVARENSISKAAEALYVSPPAVSKQLSLLEAELGLELFHRRNNSLTITQSGQRLAQFFLESKAQYQELLHGLQEQGEACYRLGFVEGWDLSEVYPALERHMRQKYPGLQFHVMGCDLDQTLGALRTGELDGAIMIDRLLEGHPELSLSYLTSVENMIIMSRNDPLLEKKQLEISDFQESVFLISAPKGTQTAKANYLAICNAMGFVPKVEYAENLSAAYVKVQTGQGVLLKTDQMQSKRNSLFTCYPIPYPTSVYFVTWAKHQNPKNQTMAEDIIAFMRAWNME